MPKVKCVGLLVVKSGKKFHGDRFSRFLSGKPLAWGAVMKLVIYGTLPTA